MLYERLRTQFNTKNTKDVYEFHILTFNTLIRRYMTCYLLLNITLFVYCNQLQFYNTPTLLTNIILTVVQASIFCFQVFFLYFILIKPTLSIYRVPLTIDKRQNTFLSPNYLQIYQDNQAVYYIQTKYRKLYLRIKLLDFLCPKAL